MWRALIAGAAGIVCIACGGMHDSPVSNPSSPTVNVTSLQPSSTHAGWGGFPLTVLGSGFTSASQVQWSGAARPTTFVDATHLTAMISSQDITQTGVQSVSVVTGASVSNSIPFTVVPGLVPGVGIVDIVSVASDGTIANGDTTTPPAVSANGRYVAFQSGASNLAAVPTNGFYNIFVRDTCIGAPSGCTPVTILVSATDSGAPENGNSRSPTISPDGRYVAFDSSATNIVGISSRTNGAADVFVRDTCISAPQPCTPHTVVASIASDGSPSNGDSRYPFLSLGARYVAFNSTASNLVADDANSKIDVFVRDTCIGAVGACTPTTALVSRSSSGQIGNDHSFFQSISADGRFVTFLSGATNLSAVPSVPGPNVFLRDTCGNNGSCASTTHLSISDTGGGADQGSTDTPWISSDGSAVAFTSFASNLVAGDTNGHGDVFMRTICVTEACTPATVRVSVAADGSQANDGSHNPSLDGKGRLIAFASLATNLVPEGDIAPEAIFIRDSCRGVSPCTPTTVLLSKKDTLEQLNGTSVNPVLSADGKYVVFISNATNTGFSTSGLGLVYIARTGF